LIILPLSRIKKIGNEWYPAIHTELKLRAVARFLEKNPDFWILLQGGYNCPVRYDEEKITKADFSFSAFSKAREKESEANCGRKFLMDHGIKKNQIMVEEVSATSEENAQIATIMLSRTTFSEIVEIKVSSLIYHLKKILPLYEKELGKKFKVGPLFAEDYLPKKDVLKYYSSPKGGTIWDLQKILEDPNRSLKELL